MNGAWLERDPAWGAKGPPKERATQTTPRGTRFLDVAYPAEDRARVGALHTHTSISTLVDGWAAQQQKELRERGVAPLQWPLYSNQPGLNDASFLLDLLPFREEDQYRPKAAHWIWEFELGCRFVKAGGRKATLAGHGHAFQLMVDSSSR